MTHDQTPYEIVSGDIESADARPLVEGLHQEYEQWYGPNDELSAYDADEFRPPNGRLVLVKLDGKTVAGGGYRLHELPETAELKRMWTHPSFRRKGLGAIVLREVERLAGQAGCTMIRLETGSPQTAAVSLYENAGYHRIVSYGRYKDEADSLCFEKRLAD